MPPASLSASLEAALLRELSASWSEINGHHFRGRLRRPALALHEGQRRLGLWNGETRTLSLSRVLVLERPWGILREVLKHEMAHQYVDEVLGVHDQTAHGPAFEAVCREHGFDGAASGLPAAGTDANQQDPVLRRIARLLALAESPNKHEAESAMKQAQRLMLKHNIQAAVSAARAGFTFRHLGAPKKRVEAAEHILAGILADHFFVDVIWIPSYQPLEGRRGRVLEACGTPANLEVAAWVHGFLLETGERLWREHKRAHGIRKDRERRRFVLGVMMGFDEKLKEGAAESREEGLIYSGDPELTEYLHRRYPRRSGGGRIDVHKNAAHEHGRRAGRGIVLHKPVPAQGDNRGNLLTSVR